MSACPPLSSGMSEVCTCIYIYIYIYYIYIYIYIYTGYLGFPGFWRLKDDSIVVVFFYFSEFKYVPLRMDLSAKTYFLQLSKVFFEVQIENESKRNIF